MKERELRKRQRHDNASLNMEGTSTMNLRSRTLNRPLTSESQETSGTQDNELLPRKSRRLAEKSNNRQMELRSPTLNRPFTSSDSQDTSDTEENELPPRKSARLAEKSKRLKERPNKKKEEKIIYRAKRPRLNNTRNENNPIHPKASQEISVQREEINNTLSATVELQNQRIGAQETIAEEQDGRINTLGEQLGTHDTKINAQETKIGEHDQEINTLSATTGEQGQKLSTLHKELDAQKTAAQKDKLEQNKKMIKLSDTIKQQNEELNAQEANAQQHRSVQREEINTLSTRIGEQDQKINAQEITAKQQRREQDEEINKHDQQLTTHNEQLTTHNEQLTTHGKEISVHSEKIDTLSTRIGEQDQKIDAQETNTKELWSTIHKQSEELHVLREKLDKLLSQKTQENTIYTSHDRQNIQSGHEATPSAERGVVLSHKDNKNSGTRRLTSNIHDLLNIDQDKRLQDKRLPSINDLYIPTQVIDDDDTNLKLPPII
jgi:chromosome segregation ATPase